MKITHSPLARQVLGIVNQAQFEPEVREVRAEAYPNVAADARVYVQSGQADMVDEKHEPDPYKLEARYVDNPYPWADSVALRITDKSQQSVELQYQTELRTGFRMALCKDNGEPYLRSMEGAENKEVKGEGYPVADQYTYTPLSQSAIAENQCTLALQRALLDKATGYQVIEGFEIRHTLTGQPFAEAPESLRLLPLPPDEANLG